ncbi:Fe-S oxidoreductase [Recurvomyces mirabilis]|uniref:tRNA 4-demethylwyosine synthase (AdoMet-dependent) n=1 Tax=Recurvomyces mirabilis TaxID=574656 RepID=A0AAE0WV19_9PEZI|nr:Fe-S oxidoreductase [Recurvomyces mirabilis]KAK5160680.1 Fe-S oxidoreductase [Recurvomyces mirabilis]
MDQLLRLPEELLYLWHTHRAEVLLSAGILFAIVRLALHWRSRRTKEILTPPLSPVHVKVSPLLSPKDASTPVPDTKPSPPPKGSKPGPKRVTGSKKTKSRISPKADPAKAQTIRPIIFYFTVGGSTKVYAEKLAESLRSSANRSVLSPHIHDLTDIDYEDFFTTPIRPTPIYSVPFYLLVLPTYNIDTELDTFLSHLQETHHDFRIDTSPLSGLAGYSVFGLGDQQEWPTEQEGFCTQAIEVDKWMARLTGRKRGFPLGLSNTRGNVEEDMWSWGKGVRAVMEDVAIGRGLGEGVRGSGDAVESADEAEDEDDEEESDTRPRKLTTRQNQTSDLEDMKVPIPVDFTTASPNKPTISTQPKPMVPLNSPTHTTLTKQGYTIIGTHSGVKICRWTKSALRGRGSCYKFSFYGIASHLCMEATPSLSCSNKCVFCWRHGTNPVGTTWRWEVDEPGLVFRGMKEGHYRKIGMMRGVPGVRAERFGEAMRIRHCALSLVGEPIFYPHINALLGMLHKEHISSFLVCNAQHPDQLAALGPVTQLYVSIDASNKESLRRIDRPLYRDFWERFQRCMDILRAKRFTHRTVFRLTLVKGFNLEEEAEGYADLVEKALPGFVEVKGVTYCGTSTAAGAGLTMQNVPFYQEVCGFVLALARALERRGLDYGIAAEHAHSCCILLADRGRFFKVPAKPSVSTQALDGKGEVKVVEGEKKWHTLIDYPAFFRCLESGRPFGPEDYVGEPTPEWALWGRGGFDPRDVRVDRKGRPREAVVSGKVEEMGE